MSRCLIEKKGKLLQKINTLSRGQFLQLTEEREQLLLTYRFCPLCFENNVESVLERRNGEVVCVQCGFVPDQRFFGVRLPFNYAGSPGNGLDYEDGMGNTLGDKGTFCLLAHSHAYTLDKRNMPMSASWLRIMMHRNEHPKIAMLKKYGRQLCHEHGFDMLRHEWRGSSLDEHQRQLSLVFSNYLGNLLKKVGKDLANINERINLHKVAKACFAYAVRKLKGENEFLKVVEKLGVDLEVLGQVKYICEIRRRWEGNLDDADEPGTC